MKLGGVIDICFQLVLKFSALWKRGSKSYFEGFKRGGVTIESYGKVEISYINVDNF